MDLSTADTMGARAGNSRVKSWILFGGNRWLLAGILAACVFGIFMLFGVSEHPPLRVTMRTSDPVDTVFQALVGALITGTTLVVTISQLVISEEIGPIGDQRARIDTAMDFRQNTDEMVGGITPSKPAGFLREIIETSSRRANAMKSAVADNHVDDLREDVETYADDLIDNAETASEELSDASFGTFDVVTAALDYNYARKMHDLRRLGEVYGDSLDDDERTAFRDTLEALTMFGPAREHIKTFYIQWALVKLSRAILYAAVPAVVVAGGIVVFVDASSFVGSLFGVDYLVWVVSAAFALSVTPFLLFTAYVLRIVTLTQRTLAIGPMILRDSESPTDE